MDTPTEAKGSEPAREDEEITHLVDDFLSRQISSAGGFGKIVLRDLSVIGAGVGVSLFTFSHPCI
jgi:hypothetical protein